MQPHNDAIIIIVLIFLFLMMTEMRKYWGMKLESIDEKYINIAHIFVLNAHSQFVGTSSLLIYNIINRLPNNIEHTHPRNTRMNSHFFHSTFFGYYIQRNIAEGLGTLT